MTDRQETHQFMGRPQSRTWPGFLTLCLAWVASLPAAAQDTLPEDALLQAAQAAALHRAARNDDLDRVRELLEEHPSWLGVRNLDGATLLHVAAERGNLPLARLLVERGAEVNALTPTLHSPLHVSAQTGQAELAEFLSGRGADLGAWCTNGLTPLHEACDRGHLRVVTTLLQRGASAGQLTRDGRTGLHLAGRGGHLEVIEALLAQGADAAVRDDQFRLALEEASDRGHESAARRLRLHLDSRANATADQRLTLLVLPFQDPEGKETHAHWRYAAAGVLERSLREIRAVRVRDSGSSDHLLRAVGFSVGGALTVEEARRIGEMAEVRRVIWGVFRAAEPGWELRARVLNVATGVASGFLSAQGEDWYDLRDRMLEQILAELGVVPTAAERLAMQARLSNSMEALDLYTQAYRVYREGQALAQAEALARQALSLDPEFRGGAPMIAALVGSQGRFQECETILRQHLAEDPDDAEARRLLGTALLFRNEYEAADRELRTALRLDPDEWETLTRLAEVHTVRDHYEAALYYLNQARRLNPADAGIHAALALAYAQVRDRPEAERELQELDRLDSDNISALQLAPQAYELLGDIPLATEYYDRFVRSARTLGAAPGLIEQLAARAEQLRATLVATPVAATLPQTYSASALQAELERRLTADERRLAVNPLESNEAIRQRARDLTRGVPGDLDRARALFNELIRRIQTTSHGGSRTAEEVFAAWQQPDADFVCNELAKLMIALVRAVGLQAFYVHLEEDPQGRIVYHDCAVVFVEGRAFLVDPAYRWFGAPHRRFTVLNDVQVVAHQLLQPSGTEDTVARCRAGVKLHPDLPWCHLQLARAYLAQDQFSDAESALAAADALEPDRWDWHAVRGHLDLKRGRYEEARERFTSALKRNPNHGLAYWGLGVALSELSEAQAARDTLALALLHQLPADVRASAERLLAQLEEQLAQQKAPPRTLLEP